MLTFTEALCLLSLTLPDTEDKEFLDGTDKGDGKLNFLYNHFMNSLSILSGETPSRVIVII